MSSVASLPQPCLITSREVNYAKRPNTCSRPCALEEGRRKNTRNLAAPKTHHKIHSSPATAITSRRRGLAPLSTNNKERAVAYQACRDSFGAATGTAYPPKTLPQYTSPHRVHRHKVSAKTYQASSLPPPAETRVSDIGATSMYRFSFRCSRPTRTNSKSDRAGPNVTVPL